MRTKLNIACALLSTLLFAACSNGDEPEQSGNGTIRFTGTSSAMVPTRADTPLSEAYTMYVQGLHHVDGRDCLYFDGAAEYVCSEGIWGGKACDYYYPPAGEIDFVAYAVPSGAYRPAETFTVEDGSLKRVTLDFGDLLTGSQDVVCSDLKTGDNSSANSPLSLRFRHAFSRIVFYLRTEEKEASEHLIIKKMVLKSVKRSGVLQITPEYTHTVTVDGVTSEGGSTVSWQQPLSGSTYDMSYTKSVYPGLVTLAADPGVSYGGTYYLPAQDGGTLTLELTYTISGTASSNSKLMSQVATLTLPANWKPGMQYRYVLTCNLSEIKFNVLSGTIVDAWDAETIYSEEVP